MSTEPVDIHHRTLLAAACRLGIVAEELKPRNGRQAARFRRSGREALVLDGRVFPGLDAASERLADDKPACKRRLERLGIPVPPGIVFDEPRHAKPAIEAFLRSHALAVCKPAIGTHGDGVAFDLRDAHAVLAHARSHEAIDGRFLLEEQAPGRDLRLQAIDGRLVAACVREPAAVTGDGESSLRELIGLRNCALAKLNPANRIAFDAQTEALLQEAGLELDDVPATGRSVLLKRVANLAQGGTAVDVTDRIHPRYAEWVERIARGTRLAIFSVDAMTTDAAGDPEHDALLLEVNARPEWIHHTFSEGRTHDIPRLILEALLR